MSGSYSKERRLTRHWPLQAVERFAGRRLEPLRFSGGARSDPWCQIHADVLNRTIEQVGDPVNASAMGAGMLASVAIGELTFDADRVRVDWSYQPDPRTKELWAELFRGIRGLYRRNRKAHARPATERVD